MTVEDVREVALSLPRAYEVLVRDAVKFRVGRLVFVLLSRSPDLAKIACAQALFGFETVGGRD